MSEQGRRKLNIENVLQVLINLYMMALIVGLPLYYSDGYRHIGSDKSVFWRMCNTAALVTIVPVMALWAIVSAVRYVRCSKARGSVDLESSALGCTITDIFALVYAGAVVLSYLFSDYKSEALWGAEGWYMGMLPQLALIAIYFVISRIWQVREWIPALFLPVSGVVSLLGVLNRFGINTLRMEPVRAEFISTIGNINWFCGYLVPIFFAAAAYYVFHGGGRGRSESSSVRTNRTYRGRREQAENASPVRTNRMYRGRSESSSIRTNRTYRGRSESSSIRANRTYRGRSECAQHGAAALIIYLCITSAALLTQGSAGGLLTLAVMLVVFLNRVSGEEHGMKRLVFLALTIFGTGTAIMLFRRILPGSFTYRDTVTDLFTYSVLPIIMTLLSILALCFLWEWQSRNRYPKRAMVRLGRLAAAAAGAGVILYIIVLIVHTVKPGMLPFLDGYGAFTFSPVWGSHRGITWSAGVRCFLEQSPVHKLFGAGPDCMAAYLYHDGSEALLGAVREVYSARLVNAHNEWITLLSCEGIVGAVAYIGMIVTGIVRLIKGRSVSKAAGACGMGLLAYTIYNMFSFQTAVNTTAAFLLFGMGEAFLRAANKRKGDMTR